MPPLSETLMSAHGGIPAGYTPVTDRPTAPPQPEPVPVNNTFLRCPLPPIYTTNVDTLKQWDLNGKVPQSRLYPRNLVQS